MFFGEKQINFVSKVSSKIDENLFRLINIYSSTSKNFLFFFFLYFFSFIAHLSFVWWKHPFTVWLLVITHQTNNSLKRILVEISIFYVLGAIWYQCPTVQNTKANKSVDKTPSSTFSINIFNNSKSIMGPKIKVNRIKIYLLIFVSLSHTIRFRLSHAHHIDYK